LSAEIENVTTVYATERVFVAVGNGIALNGISTENEGACATVLQVTGGVVSAPSAVRDILNLSNPYHYSAIQSIPYKHCQRTMPIIQKDAEGDLILEGGDWAASPGASYNQRQTVQSTVEPSAIIGRNLSDLYVNFRAGGSIYSWAQVESITHTWETEARGIGTWDRSYSLPSLTHGLAPQLINNSEITSPFCGTEPCPWATPNLSQSLLAIVCPGGNIASCGTLPTFRSYFPIACRTVFKSVDWNTGAVTPSSTAGGGIFLRSASCPGYSWGQNITDATVSAYKDAFRLADASFTGSILGTTLTVSSGTGISIGDYLSNNGPGNVMAGTYITGGAGTSWTVNNSQTVATETMYATKPVTCRHIGKSPSSTLTPARLA
jgi:hypothetical protein